MERQRQQTTDGPRVGSPESQAEGSGGALERYLWEREEGRIGPREKLTHNEFQQIQSGALRLEDPVPLSQTERYLGSCSHWPQSAPREVWTLGQSSSVRAWAVPRSWRVEAAAEEGIWAKHAGPRWGPWDRWWACQEAGCSKGKTCPEPKTATAAAPGLHLWEGQQAAEHCQQEVFYNLSSSVPSFTF